MCYAAPTVFSNVTTDPLSPLAAKWWAAKASEIYGQWRGFGGFLVKADSEGNAGPQSFNRTEARSHFEYTIHHSEYKFRRLNTKFIVFSGGWQ